MTTLFSRQLHTKQKYRYWYTAASDARQTHKLQGTWAPHTHTAAQLRTSSGHPSGRATSPTASPRPCKGSPRHSSPLRMRRLKKDLLPGILCYSSACARPPKSRVGSLLSCPGRSHHKQPPVVDAHCAPAGRPGRRPPKGPATEAPRPVYRSFKKTRKCLGSCVWRLWSALVRAKAGLGRRTH